VSYSSLMGAGTTADPSAFDCVLEIAAPRDAVFAAFFQADQLRAWWGVDAAITLARPLGVYALTWPPTDQLDPLPSVDQGRRLDAGALGGTMYGIVIDARPPREFFLADVYWLPADGDPIGPMALQVTCDAAPTGTRLRYHQSGCDDSPRWRRFYRLIGADWSEALARLKTELEAK
jgi:hypothetical protein